MREDRSFLHKSISHDPSNSVATTTIELKYVKLKQKMETRFEKERLEMQDKLNQVEESVWNGAKFLNFKHIIDGQIQSEI